ncbi:hypothetical protein JVT61DRAFT_10798 [Boletus reticuloceps]|uniref:F-box domain-containing protein n=1 Tax=Boletus reticuloceps TaxID=495285 RepID=A0A8I2YFF0_9AGAM|nr:hypothetical protein JVT61DRAFT_10798 [Boletus reticuloceps]
MSDSTALSLNRLPPAVLHVIFHYLDIPDILRIRRVSRYLNTISHSRQVWTNAYRTAEFVRPPGPFLWQSACDLEKALVCGFRVDRNLRSGQQLGVFRCVSSFDVEGRPFACAVLLDLKGATPQFSIYSLHVGEQSGVTLDLLHQFVSSSTFIESINFGPRVIVFQNDKGRRVLALDVHSRTEFLIPSIPALMEATGITEFLPMHYLPTSISTSTHVVMGRSYCSGDGRRTFFQAFPLPPANIQCSSTPLSPSHRGVIFDIEVFDNALLHDTIVDSSTKDVLITIRVHTRATGHLWKCEHGILPLSTDGGITFQLLGPLGQISRFPFYRPSGSFHGSGRAFIFKVAEPHGLISALDYDLRASGNDDNETKVAEYPRVVRCSSRHDLLDYDPYSGRLCLARYPKNLSPPVIEIVDLAI